MKSTTLGAFLLLGGVASTACGAGGAGKAVRPNDPTYAGAVGGDGPKAICHDVNASGDPLIVDWKPEDRADLEVALKKGVAVVHYDCNSLKLLPDCTAKGTYGYVGVSKKEQLITLADADEAQLNLPLNGGSIGGGLARGSELDIALAMIGKQSTTFANLAKSELTGKCDGATHFVRAATIGAFAMTTGTSGEVKVAADILGVGASGSSTSKRNVTSRDGDPAACDKADPDGATPPGQCRALLRLQLVAVAAQQGNGRSAAPSLGMSCPSGTVAMNGKCTVAKDDRVKQCHGGKLDVCEALCGGGDIDSCVFWTGTLMAKATAENSHAYDTKTVKGLEKACDAGRGESCAYLGNYVWDGLGGLPKNPQLGRDLNLKACSQGIAAGCASIGNSMLTGDGIAPDKPRGLSFLLRGCQLGSALGCVIAGQTLNGGGGRDIPIDRARAIDLFVRGCEGREAGGCLDAAESFERGEGVRADRGLAMQFYQEACRLGDKTGCAHAKGR